MLEASLSFLSYLLPPAILVLLILAPRRGGRPAWKGSKTLAAFVAIWAIVAVVAGLVWEHYGLALLWHSTGSR